MSRAEIHLKGWHAVPAALAAAVTLTSAAAAGPAATKQRVAIDMKILPQSTTSPLARLSIADVRTARSTTLVMHG